MRFIHSHSMHEALDRCPAQFKLLQDGADQGRSDNLLFGVAFHLVAERYLNHCIHEKRSSDVTVLRDFVDAAVAESVLPVSQYEALTILSRKFIDEYPIDHVHSLYREEGIALDEHFNRIPWTDRFEYDDPSFLENVRDAGVVFRLKADHVSVYPEEKRVRVDDWKTDRYVPSRSEIMEPTSRFYKQMMDLAWAAKRYIYRAAETVEVNFRFVRYSIDRDFLVELHEIDAWEEVLKAKIAHVEAMEEFVPIPGAHCSWCPVADDCPVKHKAAVYQSIPEAAAAAYIVDEVDREKRRALLKDYADANGPITINGMDLGLFERKETATLDIRRTLEFLREKLGLEHPEYLLDVSVSKLKDVLTETQIKELVEVAGEKVEGVTFNLHQNKAELEAIAASLGIETKGLKKAEIALAIVQHKEVAA